MSTDKFKGGFWVERLKSAVAQKYTRFFIIMLTGTAQRKEVRTEDHEGLWSASRRRGGRESNAEGGDAEGGTARLRVTSLRPP
jgi:hypothetical protein